MATWYLAKISFQQEMDNGTLATVKESYLIDAVSYTEAEAKVYGIMADNSPEFTIESINKKKLSDVFDAFDGETFYEAKLSWTTVSDSGKEKEVIESVLVLAGNINDVLDRIGKEFATMLVPYKILSIAETAILEVVRHIGEREIKDSLGRDSLMSIESSNELFADADSF